MNEILNQLAKNILEHIKCTRDKVAAIEGTPDMSGENEQFLIKMIQEILLETLDHNNFVRLEFIVHRQIDRQLKYDGQE